MAAGPWESSRASATQAASTPHCTNSWQSSCLTLRDPLPQLDDNGRIARRRPHQAPDPMTIAVECKLTPTIPQVRHIPKHEVPVQLVEAIPSIKQRIAKASPLLVAGVGRPPPPPGRSPGRASLPDKPVNAGPQLPDPPCHPPHPSPRSIPQIVARLLGQHGGWF